MKQYSAVQNDAQWIRRVMREERTLVDTYAREMNPVGFFQREDYERFSNVSIRPGYNERKADVVKSRGSNFSKAGSSVVSHKSKLRDGLSEISRVSVQTPKSVASSRVSYSSSAVTTTTTRQRLAEVERELEQERLRRQL